MNLRPITLAEANAFVAKHHRHHPPVVGHRWSVGIEVGGALVGVAIVGRPVARMSDDGYTAEVLRVCTDGTKNANSALYAACARAARAMGFRRIQTYVLESEPGISCVAAGWAQDGLTAGGQWNDHRPDAKQLRLDGTVRHVREGDAAGVKRRFCRDL